MKTTLGLTTHLEPVPQMRFLRKRLPAQKRAPIRLSAEPGGYSVLDAQLVVLGDIDTAGSLRVEGRLEGTIRRADVVVLGVGATMIGDIHAREVVIGGSVTGSVEATERVELQATAIVSGDLLTQSVLVQEGGVVNGRVLMRSPDSPSAGEPSTSSRSSKVLA